MKKSRISEILTLLIFEKRIKVAELARQTRLPQTTVHRIASGTSPNPHLSSLMPIAEFFSISVAQLKGEESIPRLDLYPVDDRYITRWREVPLFSWRDATLLPAILRDQSCALDKFLAVPSEAKVATDAKVGAFAFALSMQDCSMEPIFPQNTLLIIDPTRKYRDRGYVVIKFKSHSEAVFRKLIIDAQNYYVKPIAPDLIESKITPLMPGDEICGSLAQARKNYDE